MERFSSILTFKVAVLNHSPVAPFFIIIILEMCINYGEQKFSLQKLFVPEYLVAEREKKKFPFVVYISKFLKSKLKLPHTKIQSLYLCSFLIIKRKHRVEDKRRLGK